MRNVILGKVEDLQHWLLECERWNDERAELFMLLSKVSPDFDFDLMTDDDKLAIHNSGPRIQATLNSQDYCQDVDCSIQWTPMGMLAQNLSVIDLFFLLIIFLMMCNGVLHRTICPSAMHVAH